MTDTATVPADGPVERSRRSWRELVSSSGVDTRLVGMVVAIAVIWIGFHALSDGRFITSRNLWNLSVQSVSIGIMATGMVFIIVTRNIDLSVGSLLGLLGYTMALVQTDGKIWFFGLDLTIDSLKEHHWYTWIAALAIGMLMGAIIGLLQGSLIAYVGVPAFIVTLAGMLFFRGLNQFIGKSNTIPVPPEFQVIGAGSLPEFGPSTGYNNLTVLLGVLGCAAIIFGALRNRAKLIRIGAEVEEAGIMWSRLLLISAVILGVMLLIASGTKGFPVSGLILVALVIFYGFLSSKTILGRHIYAVGGNRHAAELSGVKSKKVNFFVMANMSMLAALAGMMFVARSNASGPFDGNGWELDAIAAVFIGGAAVTGGVGTVVGSIVGGLVMAVLNNGLQLEGIGADRTQMIKGLVLLLAVWFDLYSKRQGRPSIIGHLMRKRGGTPSTPESPATTQNPAEAAVTSTDATIRTES